MYNHYFSWFFCCTLEFNVLTLYKIDFIPNFLRRKLISEQCFIMWLILWIVFLVNNQLYREIILLYFLNFWAPPCWSKWQTWPVSSIESVVKKKKHVGAWQGILKILLFVIPGARNHAGWSYRPTVNHNAYNWVD